MFALAKVDSNATDGEFLERPGGIIGMYKRLIRVVNRLIVNLITNYIPRLIDVYIYFCFSGFSLCYTTGTPAAG